jgi:hypothetical protein
MAAGTIRKNFRRGFTFIAGAKRTESTFEAHRLANEIIGPLRPLRGNDHPTSGDGVSS